MTTDFNDIFDSLNLRTEDALVKFLKANHETAFTVARLSLQLGVSTTMIRRLLYRLAVNEHVRRVRLDRSTRRPALMWQWNDPV